MPSLSLPVEGPGFQFEKETAKILVSTSRPSLWSLQSQLRDQDYESYSLSGQTETKNIGLKLKTVNETQTKYKWFWLFRA